MFARSTADAPLEPSDSSRSPGAFATERRISLTETCDLVAAEVPQPSASDRRFALLVFFGEETRVCLLDEGMTVVVGREPPCEIVVKDVSISRQHARFSMRQGRISVEDLDSRNGTLRRGQRIRREDIEPGEEVNVGTARLVLVATRPDEREPRESGAGEDGDHVICSASMRRLYGDVSRVSQTDVPVLILGESGSGKEHVANTLHRRGARKDGPFIVVNCAAIPPSLLESTLFGHERGAFTGAVVKSMGMFERANGGTLFLDEIGELTSTAQAALLRAVESQRISRVGSSSETPIDVRFVAATHCDLEAMVEDGTFRQDLFFRLNGVKLVVPPLRERTDEIEPMVRAFVEKARRDWGLHVRSVAEDAMDVLRSYAWPGNVRQLRHAVERAALLGKGETIRVGDLPDYVFARAPARKEAPELVMSYSDLSLREHVGKFERALIDEALRRTGGNRRAAARLLRIPVRTLFRKVRVGAGAADSEDTP